MATEELTKQELIEGSFRRDSLTEHGTEVIETERIPGILGQMGQAFDQQQLNALLKKLDPSGSGKLSEDSYKSLCAEMVTDPAAIAKFHGDEFSFKHLITLSDFAKP